MRTGRSGLAALRIGPGVEIAADGRGLGLGRFEPLLERGDARLAHTAEHADETVRRAGIDDQPEDQKKE
ncbi:MAG: hypothetical protein ACFBSD_16785 [Paracoccaceae bacterium]